jgi:hypothetical protein
MYTERQALTQQGPGLLGRVREAIRVRHYSHRTEEAYIADVAFGARS